VLLGVRQDGRRPISVEARTAAEEIDKKAGPVEPVKCLVAIATINGHRVKIILCFHLGRARELRTLREIVVAAMETADAICLLRCDLLSRLFSFGGIIGKAKIASVISFDSGYSVNKICPFPDISRSNKPSNEVKRRLNRARS